MKSRLIFFLLLNTVTLHAQTGPDEQLFQAVKKGNIRSAAALLAGGANINARDENGHTPLTQAAYRQLPGMFRFLLSQGAAYTDGRRITDSISCQYDLALRADSLQHAGQFAQSLPYSLQQWDMAKLLYGVNTRFSALSANLLGVSFLALDSFQRAKQYFGVAESFLRAGGGIGDGDYAIILRNLGLAEKRTGEYDSAASHLRQSVHLSEQAGQSLSEDDLTILANLAEILVLTADIKGAKEVCIKGLGAVPGKLPLQRNSNYVRFMNVLGLASTISGDNPVGHDQLEDALLTCGSIASCDLLMQADILFNLGLNEAMGDKYNAASAKFYHVMQILGSLRAENNMLYGSSLYRIAENLSRTGNEDSLHKALSFAGRAWEIFKTAEHADPPSFISSSMVMGKVYFELEQYDSALICFNRPLETALRLQKRGLPLYCRLLQYSAEVYRLRGNYDTAARLNYQVLDILKQHGQMDGADAATSIHNLAIIYNVKGDYEESIKFNNAANRYFENINHGFSEQYLSGLNNLAEDYLALGQTGKSTQVFKRAFDVMKGMPEENEKYTYYLFNNLAQLYSYTGQPEAADSLMKSLASAFEKRDGHRFKDAVFYMNLGVTSMNLEKYVQASQYFNKAAGYFESDQGADKSMQGLLYCNMADLLLRRDSLQSCFRYFDKGLRLMKESSMAQTPFYYEVQLAYSLALFMGGDFRKATDILKDVLLFYKNYLKYASSFMGSSGMFDYYNKAETLHNLLFSLSMQPGMEEITSNCVDLQLALKGLILRNRIVLNTAVSSSPDPEVKVTYAKLRAVKEQLAKFYEQKERISKIDSLQAVFGTLEERLIAACPDFKQLTAGETAGWQDIQQHLGEQEAVIEFATFGYLDVLHRQKDKNPLYAAYIIRHTGLPIMVPLCKEDELSRRITDTAGRKLTYVKALYSGDNTGKENKDTGSRNLYQMVWEPLKKHLGGIETIYFSPAGLLNRINFAAIATPGGKVLLDDVRLHQFGSSRDIITYSSPKMEKENDTLAIFGGIKYDLDSATINSLRARHRPIAQFDDQLSILRDGDFPELKELRYSAIEAASIENVARDRNFGTILRIGADATEEELRFLLNRDESPALIHISTHGFFVSDRFKGKILKANAPYYLTATNSFVGSGLFFAGANKVVGGYTPVAGIEDGVVTAYDITNFNLLQTKLVVLSSCVSGLGEIDNTEGVIGLQRAFRMAGCHNLIMSLWEVEDEAAAVFMGFFYNYLLKDKKSVYDSFRAAQNDMKKKYPGDPYRWASFVLLE